MKPKEALSEPSNLNKQNPLAVHQVEAKRQQMEQRQKQVEQRSQQVELKQEPVNSKQMQPTQTQNLSTQETDEEYAKRVLSSSDYLAPLMSCAQFPQKCDLLLEIIQKRDSRLFSVLYWCYSDYSILSRIRILLLMRL